MCIQSLGQEDPLEMKWLPTPVFLPGKFQGQRSVADYSPWGHKEFDKTEQLNTVSIAFSFYISSNNFKILQILLQADTTD